MIREKLRNITNVQRIFVAMFIIYYLCRHEAYTWFYSEQLLVWPKSLLPIDPVLLNTYFPILIFAWLFTGLWYFVKPRLYVGSLFFFLSYLFVGRLNSYIFILRYDFSPMTFLLLTILLPHQEDRESDRLKDWIVKLGQFVWVSCFVTAAVAKLDAAGLQWMKPEILRDFIFFENVMQGPVICESPTRIAIVNYLMQSDVIMAITSVFVMVFEFFYPVAMINRRMALIFLVMTLFFQIVIQFLMHIEYYNYWLGILFWFMPGFYSSRKDPEPSKV